jgi:hypothetical protein
MRPIPTLTPEMRQALDESGGSPVEVVDLQAAKVYVLMELERTGESYEDYVRREVAIGLAQTEAGMSEPWDIEKVIAEARSEFEAQQRQDSDK